MSTPTPPPQTPPVCTPSLVSDVGAHAQHSLNFLLSLYGYSGARGEVDLAHPGLHC